MDNKFVLSQSFNDIVFEKRHKKYGAYQIRSTYTRYALVAVSAAVLFFTCGSLTWAYVSHVEAPKRTVSTIVDLNPIPTFGDPEAPKPEPKEEPKAETPADLGPKTSELTTNIEVTEEPVEVPPTNLTAGQDPNGVPGGPGSGTPQPGECLDCPIIDTVFPPPPPVVYEWTNHPPVCEGLDQHLTNNIRYPQMCREQGIEGVVYIQFIVDTKGNYRDVEVVKGAHPALNAEALRVMKTMPKWTPAEDDNGVLVDYKMRKPIRFELAK